MLPNNLKGGRGMKILSVLFVFGLILNTVLVGCTANGVVSDDDAWKNNTGIINLDAMSVSGNGVSIDRNTVKILKGGDFTVSGTLDDGMIYVNSKEKVKIRLAGVSITNSCGPAIFFDNTDKGFITITEKTENFLADGNTYSIDDADAPLFSNDDLEIKGNGNLYITANFKHGIAGDDDVKIENGNIVISAYEHGIKANDTLSVLGGNISVTSKTGKGMKAELEVIIDDGIIDIISNESEGIESKGTLTINGGKININSFDDGLNSGNSDTSDDTAFQKGKPDNVFSKHSGFQEEALDDEGERIDNFKGMNRPDFRVDHEESDKQNDVPPEMTKPEHDIMFDGGRQQRFPQGPPSDGKNINMERPTGGAGFSGGFGPVNEEQAKAHAITINGGEIHIRTKADGIDSNGNLTINGGKIIIDGPENAGNGSLDAQGTLLINGGTVITASGAGMLQLPGSSEQNIVKILFDKVYKEGTTVVIKEGNKEIVSYTPSVKFSAFVYTSDELLTNTEYSVYVEEKLYETFTLAQGITNVGRISGGFAGGRGNKSFWGR